MRLISDLNCERCDMLFSYKLYPKILGFKVNLNAVKTQNTLRVTSLQQVYRLKA
jgi:hypothetical protein